MNNWTQSMQLHTSHYSGVRRKTKMKEPRGYSLFVSLPSNSTHSLRKLGASVTVCHIKARLELEVGLSSDVYALQYGDIMLGDEDIMEFQGGVRNGAVLRAIVNEYWQDLCSVVLTGDSRLIRKACEAEGNKCGAAPNEHTNSQNVPETPGMDSGLGFSNQRATKTVSKRVGVKYAEYDEKKCFMALYMLSFIGDLVAVKILVTLCRE